MADASLVERVLDGNPAALARALSVITNETDGFEAVARAFFPHHGRSRTIGLCGAPGSGKSSLTSRLITRMRADKLTVCVLAVDPTSPFTGGAFLGDRIRMGEHSLDEGVFVRSLATRGMMGGLNATIFGAIHVIEAFGVKSGGPPHSNPSGSDSDSTCGVESGGPPASNPSGSDSDSTGGVNLKGSAKSKATDSGLMSGFDRILIETVGTGQDEVDIADVVDTIVNVSAPYQGDEFQAMKAGMMEIADIFAVNKADLEEVDHTVASIRDALSFGPEPEEGAWQPPVIAVSARTGLGIDDLFELIEDHGRHLRESGEGRERRKRQLRRELALGISKRVYRDVAGRINESHIETLLEKRSDPLTLGQKLLDSLK